VAVLVLEQVLVRHERARIRRLERARFENRQAKAALLDGRMISMCHQEPALKDDRFLVTCPYCGEQVEIYLEPDVDGAFVQDCEICCNPWTVRVTTDDDERDVTVTRADGSE